MSANVPAQPSALVIAHPGHELCVYHWLQLARPRVFTLTDGSGHSGKSRLHQTTRILEQVGAVPGCLYGRFTDQAIYASIMNHEFDFFIQLTEELSESFVREDIEYVVGDAAEGYNPAHDVCRLLINAATKMASRKRGQSIANFEILLTTQMGQNLRAAPKGAIWLQLDESTLAEKLSAVLEYKELAADTETILAQIGMEGLRTECLRPVSVSYSIADEAPYYEVYGEKQVAAGYYQRVLRYREHVHPLAEVLRKHIEQLA